MNELPRMHVKECECPDCGYKLNAVSPVNGEEIMPQKGDISICYNCATPLVFNEDQTVHLMTKEDSESLHEDDRKQLVQAMIAVIIHKVM